MIIKKDIMLVFEKIFLWLFISIRKETTKMLTQHISTMYLITIPGTIGRIFWYIHKKHYSKRFKEYDRNTCGEYLRKVGEYHFIGVGKNMPDARATNTLGTHIMNILEIPEITFPNQYCSDERWSTQWYSGNNA